MEIEEKVIKTLRQLSLDQIYSAKSGHLGISLGCANIMYAVFKSAIFNPEDTTWINRDRIVLSAGHGSALLYSALHLFGFLTIDDLKTFRTMGGLPGHPEITTKGVDCTTGALGQGFCNAVGMAIGSKFLAKRYNSQNEIINNYTYCICSDGDLMEGISYEASSIAGNLDLDRLIVLYDSNRVCLDGSTKGVFDEDIMARFTSQGWSVLLADGNDYNNIFESIQSIKEEKGPKIIICTTTIAYDSPFADSVNAHSPLITEDIYNQITQNLGISTQPFEVAEDVYSFCKNLISAKINQYKEWKKVSTKMSLLHPKKYAELCGKNYNISKKLYNMHNEESVSTRDLWGNLLQKLSTQIPNLIVGSADLAKSTRNVIENEKCLNSQNLGRNIYFGVREGSMAAISNGLALFGGGILPIVSTFLVFSDYMRPAIRMSAIMGLRQIFVFTHDSVMVGQDGITHQPVEQLESLRCIPRLNVFRPCDEIELSASTHYALNNPNPTALILSRQKIKNSQKSSFSGTMQGAYIYSKEKNKKELNGIIIATGSELNIALKSQELLEKEGYSVRVVSMPNRELFLKQSEQYRESVLPSKNRCRLVLELGVTNGWYRIVGLDGAVLGVDDFGETGTGVEMLQKFNFTLSNIVATLRKLMKTNETYVDSII